MEPVGYGSAIAYVHKCQNLKSFFFCSFKLNKMDEEQKENT